MCFRESKSKVIVIGHNYHHEHETTFRSRYTRHEKILNFGNDGCLMWSLLPLMGSAVLCKKVSHIVTTLSKDKQQDKKPTQEHIPPGQLPVARDQGIACEEQKVSRIATTLPEGKQQHLASNQDPF